jgi:RNA-binding protein
MSLTKNQIKFLRGKCHLLNPVVMVGQKGVTPEVLKELDVALNQHELVKVKIAAEDREAFQEIMDEICAQDQVERVQIIGRTLSVFRRNNEKHVIQLPVK